MRFRFNISISEKDYLSFNIFCLLNTPYGKEQLKQLRLINAIVIALGIVAVFLISGISAVSFAGVSALLLMLVIVEFSAPKVLSLSAKTQLKLLKKNGKKFYSPSSVIEFYEENFIETDDESRIEQKYSSIERISIVENKMIYIHINDIRAYLIPVSCFESGMQYAEFLSFISTKCAEINRYWN